MRDQQEIEKEMFHAREDLEQNLGELKQAVREQVDVPNRVRAVVEHKKQQAQALARRGVSYTKERPVLVGGIFAGVVLGAIGVMLLFRWRASSQPWWSRAFDRARDII